MSRSRFAARIAGFLAVTAALVACSGTASVPAPEPLVTFVTFSRDGVELVLRLAPKRPAPGDTLYLWSVIRNASSHTVSVTATEELRTGGTLEFQPHRDLGLYPARTYRLEPRDSLVKVERRIVASPPGRYTLVVYHLALPDIASTGEIVVTATPGNASQGTPRRPQN